MQVSPTKQTPNLSLTFASMLQEKLRFEPKDITYRSDEPGSNGPNRLVLRRKLHGERFGQKSGMKHPMGQYSHSTSDINTRMPGAEWREGREGKASKGKYGTAGVSLDKRRRSPIVEISTLLVRKSINLFADNSLFPTYWGNRCKESIHRRPELEKCRM